MNPGRELDALIAEKVMGLASGRHLLGPDKPYSTSIEAAWEVTEKMLERNTGTMRVQAVSNSFGVTFEHWGDDENVVKGFHRSSTLPHAICLAAIKAVGVEL